MTKQMYHKPVLLNESIDALITDPNGVYVDCTFGGGGHSREILKRLGENGKLFGFDQDQDAKRNIIDDHRFELVSQNFRYLKNNLRFFWDSKNRWCVGGFRCFISSIRYAGKRFFNSFRK